MIADNLYRLRLAAGLSQSRLAELSSVSQQLISQIERGENSSTKSLPALAKALGCSIADLDPSYSAQDFPTDDQLISELLKIVRQLGRDERNFLLAAAKGVLAGQRGEV